MRKHGALPVCDGHCFGIHLLHLKNNFCSHPAEFGDCLSWTTWLQNAEEPQACCLWMAHINMPSMPPHWFNLPGLVPIAPLLIYLPSSSSRHSTWVYLWHFVSHCACVDVHTLSFLVSVCVSVSAFVCERHSVWHDKRWPSLCVLHPTPVTACRTQVSVVMVIDSLSVPGRQICVKRFPLLSGPFPLLFHDKV